MPRKPPRASLRFWFNHASCTTIHWMAGRLGLMEGDDGCLPLLLGEAVQAGIDREPKALARFRADLRRDRSAAAAEAMDRRLRRLGR